MAQFQHDRGRCVNSDCQTSSIKNSSDTSTVKYLRSRSAEKITSLPQTCQSRHIALRKYCAVLVWFGHEPQSSFLARRSWGGSAPALQDDRVSPLKLPVLSQPMRFTSGGEALLAHQDFTTTGFLCPAVHTAALSSVTTSSTSFV
jgi:hypothetical protein